MSTAVENDVLKGCTVETRDINRTNYTFYIKDGKLVAECRKSKEYALDIESWYNADGKQHRDGDLPALIWYEYHKKDREYWYRDGKKHRDDGPAEIWYVNGQKTI